MSDVFPGALQRSQRPLFNVADSLSVQHHDRDALRPSSIQLARRLLEHDTPPGTVDPEIIAVGLRKTCARITTTLRNSLGADGCSALLVRALTRVEHQHPLIADMRRSSESNISFDGLVKSVAVHGIAPVTAAIEALLAALIDTLVRLVGEEMTVRLTAAEAPSPPATNGGASRS